MAVDIRRATAPLRSFPRRSVSVCSKLFNNSSSSTVIIRMRRPITLSVFLALIAASLSAVVPNQGSDSGDVCECVAQYFCRNGIMNTAGIGLIDHRSNGHGPPALPQDVSTGDTSQLGEQVKCDNDVDVCCKKTIVQKVPEDKVPTVTSPEKVTPKPSTQARCGIRNEEGVGLTITAESDNEAQFGEFPGMAAILREEVFGTNDQKVNVYQCGGALIHTQAVLTAAQCIDGIPPSQLKIRAGEWDTQTKEELFPYQDRNVKTVVIHDKFNSAAFHNDVAILILETPVELAGNVDLVCLPPPGEVFDGARCFASGWGKDKFGKDGQYQPVLKKVELPIVSHDVCETELRNVRLGKYFQLDSTFVCAGGEAGKDTCKGDGGGPLLCPLKNDPSRYAQVGIVSWGIECGKERVPGVYTNVALLRDWIDEQMVNHNLDTSVYQA